MKAENNILEIKNLAIGYKETGILADGINLTLKKGELTGLIGLNGIGKSTFLKTLLKLNNPLEGQVLFEGKNIKLLDSNRVALLCSYVSTEHIRVSEMIVYELVAIGRYPYTGWNGKLSGKDKSIVEEALWQVGLEKLMNRKIMQLSDGERQRASIARALAQDTPIIILDEPTAFLDIKNRYEIIHLLKRLCLEKEKAILFSSHDLGNLMQVADKLWIINNSSISEGAPEDMVLSGLLEEVFSSEDLLFNPESGIFLERKESSKEIKLSGEGNKYFWTKKAIERIGFSVSTKEGISEVQIVNGVNNGFILKIPNNENVEFSSIYDLLRQIKRINL
ncbi:MAG: ABC transporter ATP-binding protein [Bacteroidales bacterium]|nr:ABC transporter ATP-binding protein [Bacteroidales bacterium]